MSGRSGHVRAKIQDPYDEKKKKPKNQSPAVSQQAHVQSPLPQSPSEPSYPYPAGLGIYGESSMTLQQQTSHSSAELYARRPLAPQLSTATLVSSGVPKSGFRTKMDGFSGRMRDALTIGKAKEETEIVGGPFRPPTSVSRTSESIDGTGGFTALVAPSTATVAIVSAPPTGPLPDVPDYQKIRQWTGGKAGPKQWQKLGRDPELWDDDGDVLVFLKHADSYVHGHLTQPSFRLSSSVLDQLNLTSLQEMMAHICMDYSGSSMAGYYSVNLDAQAVRNEYGKLAAQRKGMASTNTLVSSKGTPLSPNTTLSSASTFSNISYEMSFLARGGERARENHGALRYHIAVRNFFAMIMNKSLVGISFASALVELQAFIEINVPDMDNPNAHILQWLYATKIADCRYNPNTAIGLLTWYEDESCRNSEGYLTAFCHSTAMFPFLARTAEWAYVSMRSRHILDNAHSIMEAKITDVEKFLDKFDVEHIWPVDFDPRNSDARAAAKRFRQFLISHYQRKYKTWPPEPSAAWGRWLDRTLLDDLQTDFGALYDYLVDRNVFWVKNTGTTGLPFVMKSKTDPNFNPDSADTGFTEIILAFDLKNRCLRIPAPCCLLPPSIPIDHAARKKLAKKEERLKNEPKDAESKKTHVQIQSDKIAAKRKFDLAYSTNSNFYRLGNDLPENDLLEKFMDFEKLDASCEVNPFDARRGRWLLLYMVLQVLASIVVDTPECEFRENTTYFLGPPLNGIPPWKGARTNFEAATPRRSYCWTARAKWLDEELAKQQASLKPSPIFPLPPSGPRRYGVPHPNARSSAGLSVASSSMQTGSEYTHSVRSSSSMSNYTSQTSEGSTSGTTKSHSNRPSSRQHKSKFAPDTSRIIEENDDDDPDANWPIQSTPPFPNTPKPIRTPALAQAAQLVHFAKAQPAKKASAAPGLNFAIMGDILNSSGEVLEIVPLHEQGEEVLQGHSAYSYGIKQKDENEIVAWNQVGGPKRPTFHLTPQQQQHELQSRPHAKALPVQVVVERQGKGKAVERWEEGDKEMNAERTQAYVVQQSEQSPESPDDEHEHEHERESLGMDDPNFYEHIRNNEMRRAKTDSAARSPAYFQQQNFMEYNMPSQISDFGRRGGNNSQMGSASGSGSGSPEPVGMGMGYGGQVQGEGGSGSQTPNFPSDGGGANSNSPIYRPQQQYQQSQQQATYRTTPQLPNVSPLSPFNPDSSIGPENFSRRDLNQRGEMGGPPSGKLPKIPAAMRYPNTRVLEREDVMPRDDSLPKKVHGFGGDGAWDEDEYDYESIRDFDEYALH